MGSPTTAEQKDPLVPAQALAHWIPIFITFALMPLEYMGTREVNLYTAVDSSSDGAICSSIQKYSAWSRALPGPVRWQISWWKYK